MSVKKPKRPKKPKNSASVSSWERYNQRVKEWDKKCKGIDSDKKKKENLIKKYR